MHFQTPFSKGNMDFDSFTHKAGFINSVQNQRQRSGNGSPVNKNDLQQDNIFQNMHHAGRRLLKTSNQ